MLREIDDRGYPTDYLVARLKGKRTRLINDWDRLLTSPDMREHLLSSPYRELADTDLSEALWIKFLKETGWLYYQMNSELRNIFKPFFLYSELNTLFICLRYKSGKGTEAKTGRILEFSLLSRDIKRILRGVFDVRSAVRELEKHLPPVWERRGGPENAFIAGGLKETERQTTKDLLEYLAGMKTHFVARRYFRATVDLNNINILLKHVRWETPSKPEFIRGGNIKTSILKKILYERPERKGYLINRYTGLHEENPPAERVRNYFRRRLSASLKRWERESSDIGLILNYLWRCSVETSNLRVIYHGRGIDRNVLEEELVY